MRDQGMRATAGGTRTPASQHTEWPASAQMAAPLGDSDRLLRAMTDVLDDRRPASAAEALKMLRLGYPEIPLAMRIAALCARSKELSP
jgi:hypothetical protein